MKKLNIQKTTDFLICHNLEKKKFIFILVLDLEINI